MKQARILKIVVASPGDVQAERDMIPAIVDELNKGIADERGVVYLSINEEKPCQEKLQF
jgi:hypothetical protein